MIQNNLSQNGLVLFPFNRSTAAHLIDLGGNNFKYMQIWFLGDFFVLIRHQ